MMLTRTISRIPKELQKYGTFKSSHMEIFYHLSEIERKFSIYLIQNLKAPKSFNPENYTSTLLALYEKSKEFEKHKNEILLENRKAKDLKINISNLLDLILKDKNIVECGCRNGCFLSLCKKHGANILGLTDERYFRDAKQILGNSSLILSRATQISEENSSKISNFNPDYFISVNLFDSKRGVYPTEEQFCQLLSIWRTCVNNKTDLILIPSIDGKSVIDFTYLERVSNLLETRNTFKIRRLSITAVSPRLASLSPNREASTRGIIYYFKLIKK